MPFRSKVLSSGNSPQATREIVGTGKVAVVATGTTQANCTTQISDSFVTITTSSASTGVKLPTCEEGSLIHIYNLSGQTIQIYTFETTGVTMNNAVAGSTGVQIGNTKTAICFAPSYNTWAVTCALTST